MVSEIFKAAYRNIVKRRNTSLISILGLSIGFVSFILISLFIKYELGWDAHHKNYDRIYRIQTLKTINGQDMMQTPPALSAYIKDKHTEVEHQAVSFYQNGVFLHLEDEKTIYEEYCLFAEPDFFKIFSYDFISGNENEALSEPLSITLSETVAKKLFPGKDAVGQTVMLGKKINMKITGVYKDPPENAHLKPSFIVSFISLNTIWNTGDIYERWEDNAFFTYVLLKEGASPQLFESGIEDILKDFVKTDYRKLYLNPLSNLYVKPNISGPYMTVIYLLGIFSVFILILTTINYINLQIASSTLRTKEIGIKKVIGSSRRTLVFQILTETIIIIISSLVISIIATELLLPLFNKITYKDISLSILFRDGFFIIITAIMVLIVLLSGMYPAMLITSIKSIDLFKKNMFGFRPGRMNLKKYLVGFQYTVAIALITISVLFIKQVGYMAAMDLGFNKSDLLFTEMVVQKNGITFKQIQNRLQEIPNISSISVSRGFPIHSSKYVAQPMVNWEGGSRDQVTEARLFWGSYDFANTLELEIINGRGFDRDHSADVGKSCIINETAVRQFGWKEPVGKYIQNRELQVIGVMKDIHFHDAYNVIQPLILTLVDDTIQISGPSYFAFRITPGSEKDTKEAIRAVFLENFPNDPFELKLFKDHYQTDQHFEIFDTINGIFIIFAISAILLSVLGIVGLVTHTLNRKTKEIAIRKTHGSSSVSVFTSITTEYLLLILIAAFFGSIGANFLFNTLPFNYRVDTNIWDFMIAIVLTLIVSVLAIFYKTYKESVRNPIESLHHE